MLIIAQLRSQPFTTYRQWLTFGNRMFLVKYARAISLCLVCLCVSTYALISGAQLHIVLAYVVVSIVVWSLVEYALVQTLFVLAILFFWYCAFGPALFLWIYNILWFLYKILFW